MLQRGGVVDRLIGASANRRVGVWTSTVVTEGLALWISPDERSSFVWQPGNYTVAKAMSGLMNTQNKL